MNGKGTAAQDLYTMEDSVKYDAACKRILSEKAILARIMKACLSEYQDCDVREIETQYIEGTPEISGIPVFPDEAAPQIQGMDTADKSPDEGTVTYDIRFNAVVPGSGDRIGLMINVEAQNDFYPGYPLIKRGLYYCSRMISSQHNREFTGSHYEKLKKVYSIWICMRPPKRRGNTITRYRLMEEHLVGDASEPAGNYDLLSVVMLCLGEPDGVNGEGVLRMLDVLFSDEASAAEKQRILQDEYAIQMSRKIENEVSVMCNLSKGLVDKGLAKGRTEGRAEGRAEGITSGFLISIKSLMETMGLPADQAMDALKIPAADRQKYLDLLKKQ